MKTKTWILFSALIMIVSCSKDEATDMRSAFLGSWEYAYDLSCSPGGTISEVETLEITKGDGSSKIIITFNDSGLVLECSAYSENLFGVNSYAALNGTAYTVTGSTYDDGSLDILITFSAGGSYCVQTGIASPL